MVNRASMILGAAVEGRSLLEPKEEEELRKMVPEMDCKESGAVEVIESLEREAIMGKDEGRDPCDYNRRALIFDKSSRVFQALKERETASPSSSSH